MNRLALVVAAAAAPLLFACSVQPPPPSAATTSMPAAIVPNANLLTQGIPAIPASVAAEVDKYNDFRGHAFVAWHPLRRQMLVLHRKAGASTPQLFLLASPMAQAEQLTDASEPIRDATFEPSEGKYIVYAQGTGGDEADKLYRLDLPSKKVSLLTPSAERHSIQTWTTSTRQLVTLSVPLDRTAQGGSRTSVTQTLRLMDPLQPERARTLAELPGGGWSASAVSRDDARIALTRYVSAGESEVWLLDIASGQLTQILPAVAGGSSSPSASPSPSPSVGASPGAMASASAGAGAGAGAGASAPKPAASKASHESAEFSRDNTGLFVISDRAGEFRQLMFYRFADRRLVPVTRHIPWDISQETGNADGSLIAVQANVDGARELRLFDGRELDELPTPRLPSGSVGANHFHPKLTDLAFSLDSVKGPSQVYSLDPPSGKVEQWTRAAAPPGVDMAAFVDQQIVRWKSFDGRTISGILTMPPARFTGKRPVLIEIHGGPEAQASLGFMGRSNYLINELGIAVIRPNVRGSSGYGKTFLSLDDGIKREDAVKDIGALLDWIDKRPDLDGRRVAVSGGSYGGYMSLAVAATYSDRIAASIDVVGISNFLSFLQNTESWRRDLRRVEYGDERDPAMREFLQRISPLTRADRIRKPLFVVAGRNDPRVPYTEAEQIVAKVREGATPVWYLRGENEGHGFARKENADFQFYATVMFLKSALLESPAPR